MPELVFKKPNGTTARVKVNQDLGRAILFALQNTPTGKYVWVYNLGQTEELQLFPKDGEVVYASSSYDGCLSLDKAASKAKRAARGMVPYRSPRLQLIHGTTGVVAFDWQDHIAEGE